MDDINDVQDDYDRTHEETCPCCQDCGEARWGVWFTNELGQAEHYTDGRYCDCPAGRKMLEGVAPLGGELSARNHSGQGYTVLSHERAIDHLPSF
jgi:hypothetical protein